MKEGIGATQMFIIVVVLIIAFASVMAFTVNHSNAFSLKDSIITVIEDHGGFDLSTDISGGVKTGTDDDKNALQEILDLLDYGSYRQTGTCPLSDGSNYQVGAYSRNGAIISSGEDAAFCIIKIKTGNENSQQGYIYQVQIFYSLDIPLAKSFFNFKTVGETKLLYR